MKRLETLFLNGCGYTVLLLTTFYTFAIIVNLPDKSIWAPRFFTVLLFSFIISLSEMIFKIRELRNVWKLLIHFFTLLIAFLLTFLIGDFFQSKGFEAVLAAILVYTVLYIAFFGVVYLTRRLISRLEWDSEPKNEQKKPEKYTSRFK